MLLLVLGLNDTFVNPDEVFISVTSLVSGAALVCSLSPCVSITILKSPQMSALWVFWLLGFNFRSRGFTDHLKLSLFRFFFFLVDIL